MSVKLYIDRTGLLKDVIGESIRIISFGAPNFMFSKIEIKIGNA